MKSAKGTKRYLLALVVLVLISSLALTMPGDFMKIEPRDGGFVATLLETGVDYVANTPQEAFNLAVAALKAIRVDTEARISEIDAQVAKLEAEKVALKEVADKKLKAYLLLDVSEREMTSLLSMLNVLTERTSFEELYNTDITSVALMADKPGNIYHRLVVWAWTFGTFE